MRDRLRAAAVFDEPEDCEPYYYCQHRSGARQQDPTPPVALCLRARLVRILCMHGSFPSAQAGADRLFKSNARGVGVLQHVGVSRLDVNIASLLGYDIEQSDPAIAVDLANHFEVPRSLLPDAAEVGSGSRLRTLVTDPVLGNLGSDGEAGSGNAAASSVDGRGIGNDCALVAVECL